MKKSCIIILLGLLSACATSGEKRLKRVESVALQFRPLETNIEKVCKVKVALSGSTEEKYKKSFPDDADVSTDMVFVWGVHTKRCQLKPEDPSRSDSAWRKNHQIVVRAAFCTLLQGFAIESPFSGLSLLPADIDTSSEWIQVLSVQTRKPAIELHEENLSIKATSNSGQNFFADYTIQYRWPRPKEVRMQSKDFILSLSDFTYQSFKDGEVSSTFPRDLEGFSIFTKDSADPEPKPYARATILGCE